MKVVNRVQNIHVIVAGVSLMDVVNVLNRVVTIEVWKIYTKILIKRQTNCHYSTYGVWVIY